ncbi:MAG: hypothetical protein JWO91_389 [Acidobacteriaceae bacterium]|jgi:hypothetical protein|nr:hypothetical protein [Acidobacteriaceae bacterium]
MKDAVISCLMLLYSFCAASAQQSSTLSSSGSVNQNAICGVAEPQLRESAKHEIIVSLWVDNTGKVLSFKTNSPKGLKLEKVKESADAIKAMHFESRKTSDESPIQVKLAIKCPDSTSANTKNA